MFLVFVVALFFGGCDKEVIAPQKPVQVQPPTTVRVLFSPDDHPTEDLLRMLNSARSKIYAAIYMLTDKHIAQALCDAKRRGVDVQIILDPSSMEGVAGKGPFLKQNNIDVFVFKPSAPKKARHGYHAWHKHAHNDHENHGPVKKNPFWHGAIMHNKFALIDEKVWTGSFNWTISANQKNEENVVIFNDQKAYEKYYERFMVLTKRCERVSGSNTSMESSGSGQQKPEDSPSWFSDYMGRIKDRFVDFFEMLGLFRPTGSRGY